MPMCTHMLGIPPEFSCNLNEDDIRKEYRKRTKPNSLKVESKLLISLPPKNSNILYQLNFGFPCYNIFMYRTITLSSLMSYNSSILETTGDCECYVNYISTYAIFVCIYVCIVNCISIYFGQLSNKPSKVTKVSPFVVKMKPFITSLFCIMFDEPIMLILFDSSFRESYRESLRPLIY
ncbi:hypothetical protein U3516DRAFT_747428 [Neocallimastix sp. 'constans']